MDNSIMYEQRFGMVFCFSGISKKRKENLKKVFNKFINIMPYSFEYYCSVSNLKKIKNQDSLLLFNKHIDDYNPSTDIVKSLYFTDADISKMSNITMDIFLINGTENTFSSYVYCEVPFIHFEKIKFYIIETFILLNCIYACANQVISYNPHISKSFTKAMKILEKTKTYSNKFSVYENFANYISSKNKNITFEGIDGINFIQLYSLDWFNKIKSDFIDIAVNKGLLKLEQNEQYALTQLPYDDFVYNEDEQLVNYYKELYNIYKPIIINFDKPVGFWKKDNWHIWRNRFYDVPMEPEPKRFENMKKMLKIFDNPQSEPAKIEAVIPEKEISIGEFLKANSLKSELISSEKAWKGYQEFYNGNIDKDMIPIMIDGGYDTVLNMIDTVNFEDVEQNKSFNDIFNTALIEEYQDEFDDTVKKLVKKNTDDKCEFCGDGEVVIVKLKIKYPYEVFRKIPFGGFNDCPTPEEHYQIAKYWYEEYGAMPVSIGEDYIQYYIEKPIEDINTLKKVVSEQCCYCPLEGQTVKEFAQTIYKSNFWYFWWD